MNGLFPRNKTKISSEDRKNQRRETNVLVKVLGTAQDGGIPQVGCYCKNCLWIRENPQFSRFISSLVILDLKAKKSFLMDTTPDIPVQCHRIFERVAPDKSYSRYSPDGVLLTHAHIGHYTGLMFFGHEAMSTHRLPVYCSSRMKDFLINNGPWNQLVRFENILLNTLHFREKLSLTSQVSVRPFQVPHRDEFSDTLGFIIIGKKKKLLYIPDIRSWEAWDCSIVKETEKVDIALLDGTFFSPKEIPERDLSRIGHPFIEVSINTLKEVVEERKTEIFFTHLNHTNLAINRSKSLLPSSPTLDILSPGGWGGDCFLLASSRRASAGDD